MHTFGRHIQHYLPLIGICICTVLGILAFPYDKTFQGVVTIAGAAGYVSWGIVHHYIHGDLQMYVVAEYVSIAVIGVIIVFSLLI